MLKTAHRLTGASVQQSGGKIKATVFPTEGSTHHPTSRFEATVCLTEGNTCQPVHNLRITQILTEGSSRQPLDTLREMHQSSDSQHPPGQTHHSSDQETCPFSIPHQPSQAQHTDQPMQHWAYLWCPSDLHARNKLSRDLLGCYNTQYSLSQT